MDCKGCLDLEKQMFLTFLSSGNSLFGSSGPKAFGSPTSSSEFVCYCVNDLFSSFMVKMFRVRKLRKEIEKDRVIFICVSLQ